METYFVDLIENNKKGRWLFFSVPSSLFSILRQQILQLRQRRRRDFFQLKYCRNCDLPPFSDPLKIFMVGVWNPFSGFWSGINFKNVIVIKIRIFSSTRTAVKAGPPRAPLIFHFLFSPSLPLTWEPLAPHSPRDQKRTAQVEKQRGGVEVVDCRTAVEL